MSTDTNDDDHEGNEGQASAFSTSAIESIKSILSTPIEPNEFTSTPPKVKLSWLKSTSECEDDDGSIEIVQEPPDRPVKSSWRTSGPNQNSSNSSRIRRKKSSGSESSANDSMGTKPKLTNMSLLSSSVAHSTLERCLLGCNNGESSQNNDVLLPENDGEIPAINYSKQCKPGHVIDLLELRRLSSRGIPDEPPEHSRIRASSAPVATDPRPNNSEHGLHSSTSAGNIQSSTGNPHRSYRPLVWRVLLGYLPPETDLWNEVLSRDRALYANFVKEMFSSTCPAPHERYDEEALKSMQVKEEEYLKAQQFLKGNKVFRTDKVHSNVNGDGGVPTTPKPDETTMECTLTPQQSMPGFLSARMQQEWVRGDESIFQTPDGRGPSSESENGTPVCRISPLCAMNTPRTRSRKPLSIGTTISEEKNILDSRSSCETGEQTSAGSTKSLTQSNSNDGDGDITEMMNTLLLPDDMEELEVSEDMTRSKSIKTSEVKLYRQNNSECNKDNQSITLSPSQDLDEEENTFLLDEIRKDVIRTHPDLRFFLEPEEDLGQKRYAALERILFVWAKLNKGVRYVQGMNEIVGTLYFVLAHDSNEDWANEAEADTYFLFNSIMVSVFT